MGKPAQGVMKTNDFGNIKVYHIRCSCGNQECAHDVWVEADEHQITVSTSLTLHTKWSKMKRWRQIWDLLTKGYIEARSDLVMDKQTAMNYAATLKAAVEDVEKFRNEVRMKKDTTS
jgi:hypothetical protein